MLMPPIARFMTGHPWTIERTASLASAHELMRQHAIRHLPVVDNAGNLCGMISDRDLHLVETLTPEVPPEEIAVQEAMAERPFAVTSDTPLDEVVEIMAEHKYGSVVVIGRGGVEGIFTATDACSALAQILKRATA